MDLPELLQLGQSRQQSGQLPEAEDCYRRALSLDPHEPSALYLLGMLEKQQGRAESAVLLLRSAIEHDPNQPRYYLQLAGILKIEEALDLLRSATQKFPLAAELHDGLGVMLEARGLADESWHCHQRAVAVDPQFWPARLNLAVHHLRRDQNAEAIEECRRVLEMQPDSVEARQYYADALVKMGQLEQGIAHLIQAQALDPNNVKTAKELSHAYLVAGNPSAALSWTRRGLGLAKGNTALLTYQYYALWELGMVDEALSILDLRTSIIETTLDTPAEYPTLAAFHAELITTLVNYPTLVWEPYGKTTRKGNQSGALDEMSLPLTDLFLRQLRHKVDAIIASFPDDPRHPLFGNKPEAYRLQSWVVFLQPGGHQNPHIHPAGWLSGVYYLDIPPEITAESQSGWIEFGRPPAHIPFGRQPPVRAMKPEVGKLVIFPSWTYHRTVPSPEGGTRISIAFDVTPLARPSPGPTPKPSANKDIRQPGLHPLTESFELAVQFHRRGSLKQAEALYRQILQTDPRHADALHMLGVIAHQVGKNDLAGDYIQQAIRVHPAFPDAYMNLGLVLSAQGKWADAVASYRQAVHLKANNFEAHNSLGIALKQQGQLEEAIASYRQALRLNPHYVQTYLNLGIALKEQGKLEEAIANYRQALRIKPDLAEAFNNLGIALKDQGKWEEAIANYRQALVLKPDLAELHNNLGNALREHGKYEEAIASFQQALRRKPDYVAAHVNLGLALHGQGRLEEAVASYQSALRLMPDHVEAHNNLGQALHEQGKFEAAVASYQNALRLKPDHAAAHNNLGKSLEERRKQETAGYDRQLPPGSSAEEAIAK